jgi:hypothetical protein
MPVEQLTDEQILGEFERLFTETRTASARDIQTLRNEFQSQLTAIKQRLSRPPGSGGPDLPDAPESLGRRFVNAAGFRDWVPKAAGLMPASANFKAVLGGFNTKASILTSGNLVAPVRLPGVAGYPVPPIGFVDSLSWLPLTTGNQVQYLRQTALPVPGAKTQVAEGDVKAEQTVTVQLQTEPILTIACWTSASVQALNDLNMLQVFLDQVLVAAVRMEVDRQALVGAGPTAELKGILSIASAYNTSANKTGDSHIDVVSHAITQLASTGVAADLVVLSPAEAEALRLTKTSVGEYVFGDPAAVAANPAVWGVRVVIDANMPPGQFLIGQSSAASILDREEAAIMISYEHADFFTRNLAAIRCEARVGLAVFVPAAWVTGVFPAGSMTQAAPAQKK